MLPKNHRFSLNTEFRRIKKEGRLIPGPSFSFLFGKSGSGSLPRFTFIISKKVDKRATARNRVRRRLEEAVRGFLPALESGFDGVFLVKGAVTGKGTEEIKKELAAIFRKSGLLT